MQTPTVMFQSVHISQDYCTGFYLHLGSVISICLFLFSALSAASTSQLCWNHQNNSILHVNWCQQKFFTVCAVCMSAANFSQFWVPTNWCCWLCNVWPVMMGVGGTSTAPVCCDCKPTSLALGCSVKCLEETCDGKWWCRNKTELDTVITTC